jgi:hypothetical protein
VAAWLSETVLRGRGPGASGFESHRRGRIFSNERTSAGKSDTVPTPPRGQQGSNSRPDGPPMDVCAVFHVVLSRKGKGEERVGVGGRGKYPGAPPHIKRKKEEKTSRPQGTSTVKRERQKKNPE